MGRTKKLSLLAVRCGGRGAGEPEDIEECSDRGEEERKECGQSEQDEGTSEDEEEQEKDEKSSGSGEVGYVNPYLKTLF